MKETVVMKFKHLAMLAFMLMAALCMASCGGDDDDDDDEGGGGTSLAGTSWVYKTSKYTDTFSFWSSSTGMRTIRFASGDHSSFPFIYTLSGSSGRMTVDDKNYYDFSITGNRMRITYYAYDRGDWQTIETHVYTKQ